MLKNLLYLALVLFIFSCQEDKVPASNPSSFKSLISYHTGKNTSIASPIIIQLVDSVASMPTKDLFEISPSVNGKIKWINSNRISFIPDENLTYNKEYVGQLNLGNLYSNLPDSLKTYTFHFSTKTQYFDIYDQHLIPVNDSVYTLNGKIRFNDVIDISLIEKNLSVKLNPENLNFSWVYNISDCYENFNSHHAGGRIKSFNDGYLLTVGDFKLPEDFKLEIGEESDLGKILFIDENWNSNIFSSGHRNPQGLIIKGETILSTEHGPFGGDELNTVIEGRNYGWPTSAYGFTYGLENIYELDHAEEYEEPIYFFTPSIGISELTIYEGKEFPRWDNFILITSLKDMTMYTLKLDAEGKSIIHVGEMYIGERIRDITIANDGRLVLAGDLGSLIIVNRTDKDIP